MSKPLETKCRELQSAAAQFYDDGVSLRFLLTSVCLVAFICLTIFACKVEAPSGSLLEHSQAEIGEARNLNLEDITDGIAFALEAEILLSQDAHPSARVLRLFPGSGSGSLNPLGEKFAGISRVSYLIHDDLTLVADRVSSQDSLLAEATLFAPGSFSIVGLAYGPKDIVARSEITVSWRADSQGHHVFAIRPVALQLRVGEEFIAQAVCPEAEMTSRWYLATEPIGEGEDIRYPLSAPGFIQVSVRCLFNDLGRREASKPVTASLALFVHP